MAAYVIVQENLNGDQAPFEEYRRQVIATFEPYGGKFLARGGKLTVLEGEWPERRRVIIEFPSLEAARKWWDSPEYAEAKALRQSCAKTQMLLVDAIPFDPASA